MTSEIRSILTCFKERIEMVVRHVFVLLFQGRNIGSVFAFACLPGANNDFRVL